MTVVTAGMEKKPNVGGNLRPPCFVGDNQQCVTATEGADVSIAVDLASTGGHPTTILWKRGEEELVGDRYRVSENNNTVLLNLHNVTRDDAGHYTLTAKNSAGEARRAIEIKVDGAGSDAPVFLRRLTDLAVKVGTRTRFLVEIRSSSEVTVSWHRNNEQLVEGERFHFVHEGSFFCVDVAPVVMEDGGRWTCVAVGAGGRASCSSHLNVLVPKAYKAPEFLEELQALLTEQGTVSLECKVVGVPTPVLRWYKDGQEIKAGDVFALTANPDDPTSLGTYTCEAVNCMGKAYSSSRVHVVGKGSREGSLKPADSMKPVGPAPVFKQNLRDEKIKIGERVTLACQVSVPPWPHSITWYNKEGRAEDSDRYHIMADGLGGYMIEISGAEAADEGEWKCVATSSLGARGISTCHVSMTYPKNYRKPRFLESLKAVLTDEGLVSFECKVVGFPTPQLRWFKDGQELKPGDVYQLTGTNSLGSYCCIARNCMGQATSTAELTVEDIQNQLNDEERLQLFSANQPPKFVVGLKSCEAKITEDFRFTVQVSVSPEPSISWYRDDEQVEGTERYRVSREALATCHLDISSLEIIDQAEWKCVASNEFGHSVTSCFLKLIIPRHFKKPRFLESLRAILSEEGAVNLECKVIGVPQPVLKWYKDGEELKPGDIHRIISGQDGTCCLGTYTCEARNCMGTVASSASLLGFEERLMKAATQHKLEQGTGHMLARNPSLSTIHEERTSQMYDTPATERSATVDERAEVSFSFDGKEVSVSLYETPDLTEEEALQVVEMYADQLSEHVSEHNVVELPPLRFVKETSNTGNLLMEAIVIDVTHDAFGSAAEDDLRTDADLEEFSITDDNGQQAPPLPKDVEQDDSDLFDKLDTEFLERALAPTVPYGTGEDAVAPKRPPRRKTDSSQRAKPDGDTKGSDNSAQGGVSPKEDEDRSDHYTDAVAYISEKDSYISARGSSGDAKAYNVAAVEERWIGEPQSTKSSPPELVRNTELCKKGKDEEWQAAELEQDRAHRETEKTKLKKKMRSVESGLGRSFEESTEERFGGELPGPKPERPARKGSKSRNERSIESGHGGSFEESGDDRTSSETSIGAPKIERRHSHKKGASADVGSIESYMKKIQEQQSVPRQEEGSGLQVATAEGIMRSTGKESRVSTEAQTEGSTMNEELEPQQPLPIEVRDSGEAERAGKPGHLSSSNVELPSLKSAEHVKSAAQKGEISLIESLTRSLQDIQEGLASVEKQVHDQSTPESGYAKASASVSEALNQPIEHILAVGERKTAVGAPYEENVSDKVLETTPEQTQKFYRSSAVVEQQLGVEVREECILEKTSVPVLDIVAHPVEQLQQDTAGMLQFADSTLTDTSESREDELPKQYMQSSLQTISESIHELQTGIAILRQHTAYEVAGDAVSHIDSASILATLSHPLHELRRGLAEVQQQTLLEGEIASVGQALMETFAPAIQELQEGLEALEQLTSMETGTTPITDPPRKKALQLLASPVDALQTGISQIGEAFLIEIKPARTLPRNIYVLERLQIALQSLQHAIEIVPGISTLQEISGTVIVHDIDELEAVTSLAQPLMEILLCLNILEISEFKSIGHPMLTTAERDQRLDMFMGLLSGLHSQLTQIEERISAGATKNLTSQSAHVVTVQSVAMPIRNLKRNIDAMRGIVSSESSDIKFKLLEGFEQHLKEFTESLVKIEQEAVLKVRPKQTANLNSLSTAKAVMLCLENLREAIVKVNEQHTSEDQEAAGIKAISRLERLAQPLLQIKQGLVGAVQRVLLDEGNKFVPECSPSNALVSVVSPLEMLQKEISAVERDLATKKETEPETNKYVETLLCPIKELQDAIIAVARQVTEAAPGSSGFSALESLLQPLQGLQLAITVVAPKEASLLILEGMTESFESLLRGVGATEKQILAEAMKDPRKLSVTKLGALTEPLKELQKEITLMEQKIQFESEEELALESSSLYALSGLVEPLRELQRGLLLIEHFALKQDMKPLVNKAAGLLVEPILEVQREISAINQKAAWQANVVESKGFTILETLAQPLQGLQRALSVVEEQNIMILEEALIFEKVSSLAAVEKVTQSAHELHSRISTIEPLLSCETTTKPSEIIGIAELLKLAKPLAEIHKQLVQVENHILEAGDRPISDRTFILCLEAIAKPMQELTTELYKVEQALIKEPGSKFDQDEIVRCTVRTLAIPIKSLQDSVAVMQRLAAQATETAAVFQALTEPFQDLQDGLEMVLRHTAIETSVEHCTQKESVRALQTLASSIGEIHSGIVVMKEQTVSDGSEPSLSEKEAASFLESAARNLKELQKNLGHLQHQILLEKAAELPGDIFLLTFATPVWELQRGLALIEQNALLESSEKPVTAVSMVQAIAQPVQEIHEALAQIQEHVLLEAPDTTVFDRSEISILRTLANPIHELQKTMALIEHQVVLEPNEEQLSDKIGTSVLETIANPLEELHKTLVLVEQQVFLEEGERSMSEEGGTSMLETLAHPIQDLERCIAFIQHQVALEAREAEMSDKSSVSILKTLAQPLHELQSGLLQIEEQFVMEAKEEPLSEKAELSLLKTLAEPIEQIQKSIAVIEQQVIFEAHVQPTSNVTSISALKELATPLYELQQNLVQIEQQIALEEKDEILPELSSSVLKTMAQPIHEIQTTIALIQQQDLLEAEGEEMSDRTSMSLLQTLAQPLEELQKGIAEIQQQIQLETTGETLSEKSPFSLLQALAESIQEIHRDLAVIHECAVYEGGAETMSEKTDVAALQTLAKPIHDLLESIAAFQQQVPVEHCEALSENEDVSVLIKLAQPVEELQRALLQVEQQVPLEAEAGDIQMESLSLLRKLAQPILEVQRNIALIENQAVLETAESLVTEKGNLSLLRELATPLQELQKGIVMIEQQELLEGPLSDTTNVCDFTTFVSSDTASEAVGVIYVEEQRALESKADVLEVHVEEQRALESQSGALEGIHVEEQRRLESEADGFGLIHVEENRAMESQAGSLALIHVEEERVLESEADGLGVIRVEEQRTLESEADVLGVIHVDLQRALESKADVLGVIHVEEQRALESKGDVLGVIHVEEQRALESEADVLGVIQVEEQRALESKADVLGVIRVEEQRALESKADVLGVIHVEEQRALESEADGLGVIHVEKQRVLESEAGLGMIHVEQERALESKTDVLGVIHVKEQSTLQSEADGLGVIHVEERRALESQAEVLGVVHVEEQRALESESDGLGVIHVEEQRTLESESGLGVIRVEEQRALESQSGALEGIHVEEQRGLESEADGLGAIRVDEQRALESKTDVLGAIHVEEQRTLESEYGSVSVIHLVDKRPLEREADARGIHVEERRSLEAESGAAGVIHVEEQRVLETESGDVGVIRVEEQRALESKCDVLGAIDVEGQRALESESGAIGVIHVEEQRAFESKADVLKVIHVEEQRALESEPDILGVIHVEEQRALQSESCAVEVFQLEEQRALGNESGSLGIIHVQEQRALEIKCDVLGAIHVEEQRALESECGVVGVIYVEEQRALESKADVLRAIHVEEQRALESEADILGVIHVEEQRALESKCDVLGAIHVEEQRALESESGAVGVIHVEEQRALESKADVLTAISVEEQRALESECGALGVIHVDEQRALESKADVLTAISVEEQRALESECGALGVIHVDEQRAFESKADVLTAISIEEQRALESECGALGVIHVDEQRALEREADILGVIHVEEQRVLKSESGAVGVILLEEERDLESEAGSSSGTKGARRLESTTVSQQEPKPNEPVVQEQAPLDGNISQLTAEKYEPQVAILSHEKGQGTAIVEVLGTVKEELSKSAENTSKEAGIEANVMELKEKQGVTEVTQTEEKGIDSSKVSGDEGSNERDVKYEKRNKEYGERESPKQETENECNRRKQAVFELGQEQTAMRKSETDQSQDEKSVIEQLEIRVKEKKEIDIQKEDLEEYENFNKEREKCTPKKNGSKVSERTKEQDEAEAKEKAEAQNTMRDNEPFKSREKEPEVAENNNEQEEARRNKNEITSAENKNVTEESSDKRQGERTEGKAVEVDKQERMEKELKDAGLNKIDQETRHSQKKKKRDRELMKKEEEECGRQKKEEEEAERRNKDQKEAEPSIKEQDEGKRKNAYLEESGRIKKVLEVPELEKTEDDTKGSTRKQEKAERKGKQLAENEIEQTRDGGKTTKEEYKSRTLGKRKTDGKMKDQEKRKQEKEVEEGLKESDESRQIKEHVGPANKEDKTEDAESRHSSEVVQTKALGSAEERRVTGEGMLSVVGGTGDDAESREREDTARHRKRSRQDTEDVEQETVRSRTDTVQNDNKVEWIAEGTVQKSRSFDDRPCSEENAVGRHRQYDDSLDSSDTITYSSTSSTLTPTSQQQTLPRTEGTRRIVVKDKVESGPRDARKKPTFATRLTDRTAAQGSRIKLTCSVVGSPEPVVEWLRDGLPVFGESRYRTRCEDGLASLEVLNASPGDSAEFTCVARNLHGEASSSATLKVFAGFEPAPSPPTFTRAIKDSYRFSDDELILECRVRCHPPPHVTWLKDGVPLQGSHRHQQSELADGVCRLIISSPDRTADSGQYTCVAENNVWSDQISSAVQFAGRDSYATSRRSRATSRVSRDARRPHISNVLTDHAVPLGGTAALQVEVKGTPKLDVTWLKGNEPLHFLTPNVRTFEESGVYSLVLTDVTEKEAGLYTCRAANAYGHVDTSATVGIVAPGSVRGGKPAMFINRPDMDMAVALGEDITVSFRVTGDPKPKVTWMKGVRDITNSQRSLKETIDDYVRLTLKRAVVADAGTYCILAKNVYGCDRAFFTVTIRQRARSLTPSLEWNSQTTADILRDVRDSIEIARMRDVPGPLAGEPTVVDSGRNWLTLSWPKSDVRGGAPVLAYRVEAWPLGGDGGARWIEMGVCPTNTFDAFNLKAGTQYKFRVTPRNRYGWGESVTTAAAIAVGCKVELPEFTRILPGQLKALQGSSISLECEVRGDPVPRVLWYRDGVELNDPRFVAHFDGSQRCTLTIQELRDGDSGRYMCEATNRVGRVSTFARLFVVNDPKILEADHKLKRGIQEDQEAGTDMPPQFTMRLRDRRVQMTYPVRLTCQVAGCPAPEVTWSKDGAVIKEDDHHVFWTEGNFHTLEMGHTTLEDSGCYSATARNSNGAVSCPCHLVVDKGIRAYVAPEFLFELDPEHSVREGGELRLSAQVEAYPTVGVMWHRDGVRLRPSRRTVMTLNHDGTVELALAGVSRRDAGVYSCTATNEVGRAETSTRVTVQVTEAPPTADLPTVIGPDIPYSKVPLFVTKPRSTEAVEGDTVIIHCEVVGDPKPEVMWLRDWLKPDYYRDAPHFRRVGDGPQYRLEIPRAKLDFTGAYSVIARNCHGEAKAVISLQIYAKGQGKEDRMDRSSVTHGKVQTLPVIKRELKDLRCCDGDAVTLECCVQATPAPDIRWEKGGRLLPLGGDFSAEFDGATARLHIHQVYPEDEGEYTCVAYNELGRAITSACLVVDVPEEKETLLSRQLSRPPGLLSAGSTPRSTPRTTPSRSKSPSEPRHRDRDGTPARYICEGSRPHRLKAAAPKFYAVPHNRVAEEGETVRFQCAIAGHPTPWVSWDKDGVLVTPSARLTLSERDDLRILEISEVTVEDAGFYRITLENEVGRVEASARLEVIGHYGGRSRVVRAWSASPRTSPTFGRRLVGSAARVGGRLTLACDLRGSPTPASTWYRNGELVVRSSRVIPTWDGRTARLEIENLELEDAGLYTCVAENDVGRTRCSARQVVLEKDDPSQEDRRPPVFLQELPAGVVATDGDMLDLQVRLEGTPPLDVVWVKDGVEIPDCEDFRYVDRGDGRFELRLADVFPQDAGTYSCEAYNEHGEAVTSSRLSVREGSTGVQFSKRPTPVLTSPGSTATFCARVHICGDARPRVSWTVAGRPLDCSRHKVQSDGDVHMLHIAPVELCDSGQVTCVARTGISGDGECVARTELTVTDDNDMYDVERSCSLQAEDVAPAMLIRGPADTTALRGDRVVLKATYVGAPQPVVRWLKAGHELSSGERVAITTGDGVTCLVIENMTADDSGKYVVSVENSLGADCSFASVAVEGPADPPAGRPSVSGSGNTVIVTWCSAPYDGGCMVTGYCVEMKRTQDTEWQVVTDRCHSLSYMVPGLTPAEQYVFRVRAENAHGLSDASAESEPFQMGSDEEPFRPAFEPRVVTLAPGEEFKTNYEVLEELGKGRYGVVHKVVERATGQKYAAKFIRCIKAKDREKVQEEIGIMNILRHPKLLQLAAAFESPKEVVMVMEYISGGELFERVVADDFTLTERDCILFMRQICEGVDYMHQNYVVHLDLKPENIMCHTRTSHQIKLIDFGLAQKINPDTPVRVLFGTPEFIPPEIINYEPIGVESDMWSMGVICYVLLSGLSPFMGDNDAETFANITRADYDFDDEAFDAISQDAKDFISALLVKRKEKRMTARECLQHMWLAQHDEKMSCIKLCTDKLKKFIIRRKWQKTGNAIRALGRMATLSAATRRNSNASSTSSSPRPSLSGCCGNVSRMSSLNEEDLETAASNIACSDTNSVINGFGEMTLTKCGRSRLCSERSDSGISDCSSIAAPSAHSHCQCAATLLLSKKFSISEEKETCSEKLSGAMVHGACKSGKISSVASENIQSRATDMTSGFSSGSNSSNTVPSHSAVSNVSPCSSSSAKCSAKKTDSLKQQSSVDSGVHVDVGTCPSPDIPTGNVSARKKELASSQEQQKQKDVCDEALRNVSGIVQARSAVLSAAQEEETKPKSTPRKKTTVHPPPISTSHEHSTNYQKVMAFWKR